jgi:hypothetical protein
MGEAGIRDSPHSGVGGREPAAGRAPSLRSGARDLGRRLRGRVPPGESREDRFSRRWRAARMLVWQAHDRIPICP